MSIICSSFLGELHDMKYCKYLNWAYAGTTNAAATASTAVEIVRPGRIV